MLPFDPASRAIATKLISLHAAKGVEHYWAKDAQGSIYENAGNAVSVRALPALEARYDDSTAGVIYHHSHPDERALGPTDFELLARPGVRQIWAHSPEGSAYGAEIAAGIDKRDFLSAFHVLRAAMLPQLVDYPHGNKLTDPQFEELRDVAVMSVLEMNGWISAHIQLSDIKLRAIFHNIFGYMQLVNFFDSKMPKP
jgi:hypothetical protein